MDILVDRKFSELSLAPRLAREPKGASVILSIAIDRPAVSGFRARRARKLSGRVSRCCSTDG